MDSIDGRGLADPEPEDLTGRARIRHAALAEFGEHGFERATVRGIAARAGVSAGLVRHHFGSKEALRQECDEYLARTVRRLNDRIRDAAGEADLQNVAASRTVLLPYQPYLARTLVDGTGAALFDLMVEITEEWLTAADRESPDPDAADPHDRAAVWTAMALSVAVLHRQLSRSLGTDVLGPEGIRRLDLALLDIYSRPIVSQEYAAMARAALRRVHDEGRMGRGADLRGDEEHGDD